MIVSKKYPEYKDKCLLITSEHPYKITNASIQFKDKFLFYSPAITTAADFSTDAPQDHFIFIRGRSISPLEIFQQTTRTRNIKACICL